MRHFLLLLLFVGSAALAQNGQPTKQSGNITPGHAVRWTTNGVIQDAGIATNGSIINLGLTPGPFCINTGPITGPYQQLCLSASLAGPARLSLQNFGGAIAQGLQFTINGTSYQFPYTVGGIVGPVSTVVGDAVCWNNTAGSLVSDCGAGTGGPIRVVTTGNITVANTDGTVVCNKSVAAATAASLPAVATMAGRKIHYIDLSGLCGDTTITPNGSETIAGKATWIVGSGGVAGSGGSITLIPSTALSGWLVE